MTLLLVSFTCSTYGLTLDWRILQNTDEFRVGSMTGSSKVQWPKPLHHAWRLVSGLSRYVVFDHNVNVDTERRCRDTKSVLEVLEKNTPNEPSASPADCCIFCGDSGSPTEEVGPDWAKGELEYLTETGAAFYLHNNWSWIHLLKKDEDPEVFGNRTPVERRVTQTEQINIRRGRWQDPHSGDNLLSGINKVSSTELN